MANAYKHTKLYNFEEWIIEYLRNDGTETVISLTFEGDAKTESESYNIIELITDGNSPIRNNNGAATVLQNPKKMALKVDVLKIFFVWKSSLQRF